MNCPHCYTTAFHVMEDSYHQKEDSLGYLQDCWEFVCRNCGGMWTRCWMEPLQSAIRLLKLGANHGADVVIKDDQVRALLKALGEE